MDFPGRCPKEAYLALITATSFPLSLGSLISGRARRYPGHLRRGPARVGGGCVLESCPSPFAYPLPPHGSFFSNIHTGCYTEIAECQPWIGACSSGHP